MRPFRFLHAADLRLDQPIHGLAEPPQHLLELLVDCPLRAAARVFDAAIDQRIDFVLLAGNVIDPRRCAPREILFLQEQFERLAERDIAVYWAGGAIDSHVEWPKHVARPGNVKIFPAGRSERIRHESGGVATCEITGAGHSPAGQPRPFDLAPSSGDLFSIAIANADWNCGALGGIGTRYWALGGFHQSATPLNANCVAHYPGTPQARCADEPGPHGCTLVSVDEAGRIQLSPIACDLVRWQAVKLSIDPVAESREDLEILLWQRTDQLLRETTCLLTLVDWTIACRGPLAVGLAHGKLANELLINLRAATTPFADSGRATQPTVWPVCIRVRHLDELPEAWGREESIRGDYLRAIEGARGVGFKDHESQIMFSAELSLADVPAGLRQGLQEAGVSLAGGDRAEVLRQVAWLGADVLSGRGIAL